MSHLSVFDIYMSLQQLSTFTTMADKAILATLPKLNGSNWFEWKKEVETFLLLTGLDGVIDAEDVPTGTKATEWMAKDHKMYVYLFFLIKLNYCASIINIKSSHLQSLEKARCGVQKGQCHNVHGTSSTILFTYA